MSETTNGSKGYGLVREAIRWIGGTGAALGLVYFGRELGRQEEAVRAMQDDHVLIEQRVDAKMAREREILLAELRVINTKVDAILDTRLRR